MRKLRRIWVGFCVNVASCGWQNKDWNLKQWMQKWFSWITPSELFIVYLQLPFWQAHGIPFSAE